MHSGKVPSCDPMRGFNAHLKPNMPKVDSSPLKQEECAFIALSGTLFLGVTTSWLKMCSLDLVLSNFWGWSLIFVYRWMCLVWFVYPRYGISGLDLPSRLSLPLFMLFERSKICFAGDTPTFHRESQLWY